MDEPEQMTFDELLDYLKTTDNFGADYSVDHEVTVEWEIHPSTAMTNDTAHNRLKIQEFLESIGFPTGGNVRILIYRDGQFASLQWTGPTKLDASHRDVNLYTECDDDHNF